MAGGRYELLLAKEDFKFSAAHFTLFPDGSAERLHGHNYRVRARLRGTSLGPTGLLVDVAGFKARIRALCAELDERVLLPARAPGLELRREGEQLHVVFGKRRYQLPAADAVELPVENVSVELLARALWERLAPALDGSPVAELAVEVEETAGQSCTYTAALDAAGC